MKFKIEISMLLLAISFYISSALCYSYSPSVQEGGSPYRLYAYPLIAFASVFLTAAAVLYSKRKKCM